MDSHHTDLTPTEKGVALNRLTNGPVFLNEQGNVYGSREVLRISHEVPDCTIPGSVSHELEEVLRLREILDFFILDLIPPGATTSLHPADLHKHENITDIIDFLSYLGYRKCAKRIAFLQNFDDFEEGEKPLSLESARSFFSFLRCSDFANELKKKLGEPLVGIFPEGTLSAEWRASGNKHLLLEFHSNDFVSFAMIVPGPESENGKFRLNGRGSCREVINALRKQGTTSWKNC